MINATLSTDESAMGRLTPADVSPFSLPHSFFSISLFLSRFLLFFAPVPLFPSFPPNILGLL